MGFFLSNLYLRKRKPYKQNKILDFKIKAPLERHILCLQQKKSSRLNELILLIWFKIISRS